MSEQAKCALCGEPMPPGEEMFKYHGYSCECPKPPLPKPPSDIAELIERLRAAAEAEEICDKFSPEAVATMREGADALSRLTTPPLPDEIAEIVGGLEAMQNAPIAPGYRSIAKRSAATIRGLAQERDDWKAAHDESIRLRDIAIAGAKVAMRDKFLESDEVSKLIHDHVVAACRDKEAEFSRERDGIRAKTIEEVERRLDELQYSWRYPTMRAAIRALAQTDEGRKVVHVRLSTIPRNAACCQGMKDNEPFAFNSETREEVEIKFCPFCGTKLEIAIALAQTDGGTSAG